MKGFILTAAALLAAGCGGGADMGGAEDALKNADAAERALATAEPTGPATSCVTVSQIRSTQGLPDGSMIFTMRSGDLYRNDLNGSCPGARRDVAFSYTTPINRLCRGQIMNFFDPVTRMPYGNCAAGDFVPIASDAADAGAAADTAREDDSD